METITSRPVGRRNHNLTGDLAAAFEYWDECRRGRIGPKWTEFSLSKLPKALIPWCSVVDVSVDPIDFKFRFWGTSRAALQGRDLTGLTVNDLRPDEFARMIFLHDIQVVEDKTPLHSQTTLDTHQDEVGAYEFLRVPFSEDGKTVSAILAMSSYNEAGIREMHRIYGTKPSRFGP